MINRFASKEEVRWCPGCGDYAVLKTIQKTLPQIETELNLQQEDFVFVSGIGCAARLPYYLNTYGFHTIHGRAPSVATGLKVTRPELSVWVITGDGDGLSIGAGHLIHTLRRNLDLNILLLNNRIYGLTKGQYSPTSEQGKVTASTPVGSIDVPLEPLQIALASGATFVARVIDIDAHGLQALLLAAAHHKGTAFIEIYQNCNIYNDGVFKAFREKSERPYHTVWLRHGEPLLFGIPDAPKGVRLNGLALEVVDVTEQNKREVLIHDATNQTLAMLLSKTDQIPKAMGVIYQVERPSYEALLAKQPTVERDLASLLDQGETWEVH